MTTEWIDKPDGDGLWWRCIGREIMLCVVKRDRYGFALYDDGAAAISGGTYPVDSCKWQRCDITKPEPYAAPKPPKVERFTAKFVQDNKLRFITRVESKFVATNADNTLTNWMDWSSVNEYYTDIKPIEAS